MDGATRWRNSDNVKTLASFARRTAEGGCPYMGLGATTALSALHRYLHARLLRKLLRLIVTCVGVADHAHAGVGGQDALDALRHLSVPSATVTCPACRE